VSLLEDHIRRFNEGIRSGDFGPMVDGFTEDAELRFEGVPAGPFAGREAIAAAYVEQPPDDEVEILGVEERDDGVVVARYAWKADDGKQAGEMLLTPRDGRIAQLVVTFAEPAEEASPERQPALEPTLVQSFVSNAHGDFEEVKRLLDQQPALVNASWDWGGGDWETGLGAAAHMGRRDIAELLLDRGARLDLFAAAMLGELAIVRAMLDAFPELVSARGPHGIPLRVHAEKGGEQARAVLELLDERAGAR
jgi:hypothetical protein